MVETSTKPLKNARLMKPADSDLLYQRANMTNLEGGRRSSVAEFSADAAEDGVVAMLGEGALEEEDDDVGGDGGTNGMVLHEFVSALIRLAWTTYSNQGGGIGPRLTSLIEKALLPRCAHMVSMEDSFDETWVSRRVQAVTRYYIPAIVKIFAHFAAADKSITGDAGQMSLPELVYMFKAGSMLDDQLTPLQMTSIFTRINAMSFEKGGDEDAQELDETEFVELLGRACNIKIPESNRHGEPFEHTWQSFLQLIFIPTYNKLIKQGKTTMK